MNWEIEYTNAFGEWYVPLDESVQDAIIAAGDYLEREGPGRGRPLVDTIQGSRHANMKVLRPVAGHIRIFSPLILVAPPGCSWVETRAVNGIVGIST